MIMIKKGMSSSFCVVDSNPSERDVQFSITITARAKLYWFIHDLAPYSHRSNVAIADLQAIQETFFRTTYQFTVNGVLMSVAN
jgi:hypothetical protein